MPLSTGHRSILLSFDYFNSRHPDVASSLPTCRGVPNNQHSRVSGQPGRLRRMCCSWMMVVQIGREVAANDIVVAYGRLEQVLLHTPGQIGPQREGGLAQQTLELVS
jgi:hypothetical protein